MDIQLEEVACVRTTDGKLFTSESEAIKHQTDIIGELLDDLLPHDDRGNVTQVDRFNLLTKMLDRPDLAELIKKLYIAVGA